MGLQAVCGCGDDGSNHECFVNIYTAAGWKNNFHNKTSSKNGEENAVTEPPSNLTGVKTILSVRVQNATYLCLKRWFQH